MDSTTEREPNDTQRSDIRPVGEQPEPVSSENGGRDLVEKAADSAQAAKSLTAEQHTDALAWLLQDAADDPVAITQRWELNVGTDDHPNIIEWVVRPLDADTMNGLRQRGRAEAGQNRAQRRGGQEPEIDLTLLNQRMVAAATVEPDLQKAAELKGVNSADPLMGPVLLLRQQFRHKPGLLDQVAQKVMLFSGYDDADITRKTPEMQMIQAAGNS